MTTAANISPRNDAHWYYPDGRPCYELPKASGDGTKVPTLADARKLNLRPSVTTILKLLDKPALNAWKIEQAVLAVLTSPQKPGEPIDDYTQRILQAEQVHDQEAKLARERGIAIHDVLEKLWLGRVPNEEHRWIWSIYNALRNHGQFHNSESVFCDTHYGGRIDLVLETVKEGFGQFSIFDYKTTRKIPKYPYQEHRLQLAAYASAWRLRAEKAAGCWPEVRAFVVYISTAEIGSFSILEVEDWYTVYEMGFQPLLAYWQWTNDYRPTQ